MRGFAATVAALLLVLPPLAASGRATLPEVEIELVAEGFVAPIFPTAPADGSGRRFVARP